jgi:molybdopterin synthase sulfur carrier subunit
MKINVLSFGSLSELVGSGPVEGAELVDSDAVKQHLILKYPELSDKKFVIAVNKNIIQHNTVLGEFDTVAILPPFSGG